MADNQKRIDAERSREKIKQFLYIREREMQILGARFNYFAPTLK